MHAVEKVERHLKNKGFATYVAVKHRSVEPIDENIFRALSSSEYFLFIDFRREQVMETTHDGFVRLFHRGSLFSHQELALACFLKLDAVGFQQYGMRKEGMLGFVHLNCFSFQNAGDLPDLVTEKIKELRWNACWKAQLRLDRKDFERGGSWKDKPFLYHIEVWNLHERKPATNCTAFLHEIKRKGSDVPIHFNKFELKWAGTDVPYVTIMPGECRTFDAFYIKAEEPSKLQWEEFSHADTPKVCPDVQGPGTYEFIYEVTSLNFPVVRAEFQLELKETLDEVSPMRLIGSRVVKSYEPY